MIKATIQNSPYCTEIRFPCSEAELSKKLGEIKMNPEHLAPMATVIEIEPAELSMLTDCDVSLDALNYLGKRLDGMDESEHKQYLAALSCPEISEGWGLKNIINLTDNLARYTLIEDTDDLERIGLIHMLNVRGGLSESEYNNSEWLAEQGMKLLESGKGIDTEYGKIFVNNEIPFSEYFNGTTFPPYLYNGSPVTVDISYMGLMEMVELPCEEMSIKKAECRIGAGSVGDCKIEISTFTDLPEDLLNKVMAIEQNKDIFGLNNLLKTVDFSVKQEQPVSIFKQELSRRLGEDGYNFSFENGEFAIVLSDGDVIKIRENDVLYSSGDFSEVGKNAFYALYHLNREVLDYCTAYEKAEPLIADGLSEKYRCLAEFGGTVLAAKHTEYGFEFVTWDRTYDGNSVRQGNYYSDYAAAKENFATRSGLVNKEKLFSTEELERIGKCIDFTVRNNGDLKDMGNMRTLAFQVPEELFQKIKDYLQRNNMTQKQFVIGLIENEIERDLTQRAAVSEAPTDSERVAEEHAGQQETAAVSDCESVSEEVGEQPEEQESADFSDDFGDENEEYANPDEDEDLDENGEQNESEEMGMSIGM